ncbi:ABC transporter ATP-binding protein [Aeromicrobium sp.]|uniref:ABC transporter ATP-binding protein n=1 Tax=Aeromicrobium sp. TaxID=1871063 RepID=UPI00199617EE|nr:ABC transporter ATP-binding protein [Aeromicrobium sp.]MBC7630710.1 ABC transporter ATP-binding protein [Aeromicrobium sp.]
MTASSSAPAAPAAGAEPLLSVHDGHMRFGGVVALDGPSFELQSGQICGLIGPNGAGKTTLFNCISRLYEPDSGTIDFAGTNVLSLRTEDIASVGISRTFQNLGLFPSMTVLENALVGGHRRTDRGFWSTALGLPGGRREERREIERAHQILAELGLESVAGELADGLPFGTLKRVELARALMVDPQLLLLDEPANGLNHSEVAELAETIRMIRDSRGLSILLVEHHMGMVMSISDAVVVLNFGRVIAQGDPAQVRSDPAVVDAYLGGAT